MSPALPDGEPVPEDGALPASAAVGAEDRALAMYLHVPFCRVRCGYCDFTTYTAEELGGAGSGSSRAGYAAVAAREVEMSGRVLAAAGLPPREVGTVFVGGGTPTLLPAADLVGLLDVVRRTHGLAAGAEVTTEANPDSVTPASLAELAAGGFTRVSFGMQSAVPHVLATLDRTHDPARVPDVVRWARDAGLQVSLDLIYGTPGETIDDWRASLEQAIAQEPDHLSAYALIVEPGTKLARQIRRGEVPEPDEDLQADMYELADRMLAEAGYEWYEVSNWARGGRRSRHNLAYWQGHDWWGVGPGAHSHVGGVRWWNVKHPAAYADRVLAGASPGAGRETLDDATREVERVLLGARIRDGLAIPTLTTEGRRQVAGLIADGLVDPRAALAGTLVLTLPGRLLADAVVRRLLED